MGLDASDAQKREGLTGGFTVHLLLSSAKRWELDRAWMVKSMDGELVIR
jgi:hypothetical protein